MLHSRKFRAKCKCGEVLSFRQGPRGYKTICAKCGAVVRLKAPPVRSDSGTVYNVPDSKLLITCPCGELFATTFQNLGRRVACPQCGKLHLVHSPNRDSSQIPTLQPSDTDEIETVKG